MPRRRLKISSKIATKREVDSSLTSSSGSGAASECEDGDDEITFKLPNIDPETIKKWINIDSSLETSPPITDQATIREVADMFQRDKEKEVGNEEEDNDDAELNKEPVTNAEARTAMEVLNRFVMQKETNDRDMNIHRQYKNIMQRMTSQKFAHKEE